MSFIEKMQRAAEHSNAAQADDPWRKPLKNALRGVEAMSTVALLDLVGARHTTENARRLAVIMRDLKFIPIQSRRLMPGGFRNTVTRGWTRPMRPLADGKKVKPQQATPFPPSNAPTTGEDEIP
jgi:hypothetical protein